MQTSKRYLKEMVNMFQLPEELYTMKRGIKYKGDLRYDITIIPPIVINGHFNKTKGHIHSSGHDEWYEVLEGKAAFIFQRGKEWQVVFAKKGQKVFIPGEFYHNTTNIGKKTLKLANWVSKKCVSDYSLMEKKKGMMYYITTKGTIKNPNYK